MNTQMTNHVAMEKLFSVILRLEKTIKPVKHSRFSDSIEIRFEKETERTLMIESEIWFQNQPIQKRIPKRRPKKIVPKYDEVKKVVEITKAIQLKRNKRCSIKTINVIYAFILIVLVLLFCHNVDFNMRNY